MHRLHRAPGAAARPCEAFGLTDKPFRASEGPISPAKSETGRRNAGPILPSVLSSDRRFQEGGMEALLEALSPPRGPSPKDP